MSGSYLSENGNQGGASLSRTGWFAFAILVVFIALSSWYAVESWDTVSTAHLGAFGWFALLLGSIITIAVGGGLMALFFYSGDTDHDR